MRVLTALALGAVLASPAYAGWTLDNDASRINFVSTKANAAAEVHTFGTLNGTVDDDGNATLSIDLNTVDTAIEIRDERMRSMLFETEQFPAATLAATVDMAVVSRLAAGDTADLTSEGQLMVHGTTSSITFDITVSRLTDDRILVASR